ncbi:MAG: mechanosensitive ion channel protein [Gammaproteobacteria bacterium]|jgi:small-conductance mechanosensitive channel/CRP-like cAMP-binding protein|nr:mechanosensitive ion channel protein [Gammaproteobacteria bacterium]
MTISFSSILAAATDPLFLAGVVIVLGFFGARYWQGRSSLAHFLIQLLVFVILTSLLLAGGVVPYRPGVAPGAESRRLFVSALEVIWWLGAAWLAVGFLRAFVVLGRQPRESKLVQDLLAALIYLAATFAIVADVFDLPVRGLLATSGAVAIIIGLALQSSLGDVFSGIVLNIEGPYRVGDWIILDDTVQGKVIETNWRATHILTGNQDVAIIPNSVIAKSKLVNCSTPTRIHGASIRVKLEPSLTPIAGCNLLKEVLLGSTHILRTPEPTVTIKDLSAEMIDFELSYSVADVSAVDRAQNELFDRVYRAAAVAGARFSPRLAGAPGKAALGDKESAGIPERLLAGISLFSTLTAEEKVALASQMQRKDYKAGEVIVRTGTILQALCIVSYGVLVGSVEENGRKLEVVRLAPGDYFGESGLLTGKSLNGEVTTLTRAAIYEISKDALAPLLKARPNMAEELSETLASLQLAHRTMFDHTDYQEQHQEGLADRVAANIRRLFSLH